MTSILKIGHLIYFKQWRVHCLGNYPGSYRAAKRLTKFRSRSLKQQESKALQLRLLGDQAVEEQLETNKATADPHMACLAT